MDKMMQFVGFIAALITIGESVAKLVEKFM
jgi:hypothetical protein